MKIERILTPNHFLSLAGLTSLNDSVQSPRLPGNEHDIRQVVVKSRDQKEFSRLVHKLEDRQKAFDALRTEFHDLYFLYLSKYRKCLKVRDVIQPNEIVLIKPENKIAKKRDFLLGRIEYPIPSHDGLVRSYAVRTIKSGQVLTRPLESVAKLELSQW